MNLHKSEADIFIIESRVENKCTEIESVLAVLSAVKNKKYIIVSILLQIKIWLQE